MEVDKKNPPTLREEHKNYMNPNIARFKEDVNGFVRERHDHTKGNQWFWDRYSVARTLLWSIASSIINEEENSVCIFCEYDFFRRFHLADDILYQFISFLYTNGYAQYERFKKKGSKKVWHKIVMHRSLANEYKNLNKEVPGDPIRKHNDSNPFEVLQPNPDMEDDYEEYE